MHRAMRCAAPRTAACTTACTAACTCIAPCTAPRAVCAAAHLLLQRLGAAAVRAHARVDRLLDHRGRRSALAAHRHELVLERLAQLALLEQRELHLLEPAQRAVRRGEVDALGDAALIDDDAAELARLLGQLGLRVELEGEQLLLEPSPARSRGGGIRRSHEGGVRRSQSGGSRRSHKRWNRTLTRWRKQTVKHKRWSRTVKGGGVGDFGGGSFEHPEPMARSLHSLPGLSPISPRSLSISFQPLPVPSRPGAARGDPGRRTRQARALPDAAFGHAAAQDLGVVDARALEVAHHTDRLLVRLGHRILQPREAWHGEGREVAG